MTRASYLESARVMPLGAPPMAWICAAEWPALSPPLTRYRSDSAEEFQTKLKRDQWCVVLPEFIYQDQKRRR
jgi:hypothetical protein